MPVDTWSVRWKVYRDVLFGLFGSASSWLVCWTFLCALWAVGCMRQFLASAAFYVLPRKSNRGQALPRTTIQRILCVTRRKQHRPGIAPNDNTTHVPTAGSSAALTKPSPTRHPRAKGKTLLHREYWCHDSGVTRRKHHRPGNANQATRQHNNTTTQRMIVVS